MEKLRTDAAEAALIRDLSTDKPKPELFSRLADCWATLTTEAKRAMTGSPAVQRAVATGRLMHFSD